MGWKIEVGKMVLYMMFPVAMFHYFNQPQYYQDSVLKLKREIYPPVSEEANQRIREKFAEIRRMSELKELKELEQKTKS